MVEEKKDLVFIQAVALTLTHTPMLTADAEIKASFAEIQSYRFSVIYLFIYLLNYLSI